MSDKGLLLYLLKMLCCIPNFSITLAYIYMSEGFFYGDFGCKGDMKSVMKLAFH
jgi:hypothetical protein